MGKKLAVLALVFTLLTVSCDLIPQSTPPPEPLTLPTKIYEREFEGHRVTITLQPCSSLAGEYCFEMDGRIAEGTTKFGVFVIQIPLLEGYRSDLDWVKLRGDKEGSGGTWERPASASGETGEFRCEVGFGLGVTEDYPVAVFVRLLTGKDGKTESSMTYGPVMVLQKLPDGKGVGRVGP